MKKLHKIILGIALSGFLVSCEKGFFETEDIIDPNAASVESVLRNASKAQINQLGIGLQGALRLGMFGQQNFYHVTGSVGREVIYSAATESRYAGELLGKGSASYGGTNDPAGIMNAYYNGLSSTRRRAEIFAQSAANTSVLTAQEKAAVKGFTKTIQAFVILNLANAQESNGIRESFSDLSSPGDMLKPGKFGTYASALDLAKKTVDEGLVELNLAGTAAFPFTMTTGWSGFNTPTLFKQFNRAIAARIALHRKDWAGVLTALNESFLNLGGDLKTGPQFTFSTTAGDIINTQYVAPNNDNNPFVVFNDFVSDAEAGDTRVFGTTAKVATRTTSREVNKDFGTLFTHEVVMYPSNTSPISIIRNEELVLMYAEAQIQTGGAGLALGEAALDQIRTNYGLGTMAVAKPAIVGNQAGLIDEVLNQRRYSLFFEGQRWFDMRRYNKLADLPFQGTYNGSEYKVFQKMARPDAEVQWDKANP